MLIQKLIHVNSQAPVAAIEVQQKKRGPKPKQANENRAEINEPVGRTPMARGALDFEGQVLRRSQRNHKKN
jgi:hypothetical protein